MPHRQIRWSIYGVFAALLQWNNHSPCSLTSASRSGQGGCHHALTPRLSGVCSQVSGHLVQGCRGQWNQGALQLNRWQSLFGSKWVAWLPVKDKELVFWCKKSNTTWLCSVKSWNEGEDNMNWYEINMNTVAYLCSQDIYCPIPGAYRR